MPENHIDVDNCRPVGQKRKRPSKYVSPMHTQDANETTEPIRQTISVTSIAEKKNKGRNTFTLDASGNHDRCLPADTNNIHANATVESEMHEEDGIKCAFISQCTIPKRMRKRRKRFSWSDNSDRYRVYLVIVLLILFFLKNFFNMLSRGPSLGYLNELNEDIIFKKYMINFIF